MNMNRTIDRPSAVPCSPAVVGALAAGLTAGLLPISASAQDYPSQPIS